jgi:phospholipase/carboxylesterase
MNKQRIQIGELEATLIGQHESPKSIVVLCHGYGAPGDDLVGIGESILAGRPELATSTLWVFPEAPIVMDEMYGGRAWWPLNVAALVEAVERGDFESLEQASPPGIVEARRQLTELIETLMSQHSIGYDMLVLGGFSQGSMISTDVALHLSSKPALLVIYSGALICRDLWAKLAAKEEKLNVFQTHGEADPVLGAPMGAALHALLIEHGHQVSFQSFMGGHTIPMPAIQSLADEMQQIVSV